MKLLQPLREGAPIVTEDELKVMEQDWKRYRAEWIIRKKIFRE
jgi:26S proteasome regulatory subunit (ATPase 3-interacting protein)